MQSAFDTTKPHSARVYDYYRPEAPITITPSNLPKWDQTPGS